MNEHAELVQRAATVLGDADDVFYGDHVRRPLATVLEHVAQEIRDAAAVERIVYQPGTATDLHTVLAVPGGDVNFVWSAARELARAVLELDEQGVQT